MRLFAHALLTFTILATFAAICPAQHASSGGGHPYGAAPFSAPVVRGTQPLGGGRNFPVVRGFGPPPLGLRAPAAGYSGIDPGALRPGGYFGTGNYRHRNYGQSFYGAYPFFPAYYPPLAYGDSGYDAYPPADTALDPGAQSALVNANVLGDQIQQLSAEVEQLRNQQQPAGAPPTSDVAPSSQPAEPTAPPLTLVLRDGQRLQVQSYAVVDQTFWDFTNPTARKIPLANVDLAASAKATEANGGEFPLLGGDQ